MHKNILIMNEGVTYNVENKNDCVNAIIEEYKKFDISMHELLAGIEIRGFSSEDVVYIYAKCMSISDGDTIVHFRTEINKNEFKEHEILGVE